MSKKVVIRVLGGLGNQMFQYASALGLARRIGAKLQLDLDGFGSYASWDYQLDLMNVPQDLGTTPKKSRSIFGAKSTGVVHYEEPHLHFDAGFLKLDATEIYLKGYFQCPHYFCEIREELLQRFSLKSDLSPPAVELSEKIQSTPNAVSLHVRRGDYLKLSDIHPCLTGDYYRRAVDLIQRLHGDECHFFMFSDDTDFLQNEFQWLPHQTIVEVADKHSDAHAAEEMHLMSHCDHHITANSSFSWWGAWLNPSKDKQVIAPRNWLARSERVSSFPIDLYEEDWISLG